MTPISSGSGRSRVNRGNKLVTAARVRCAMCDVGWRDRGGTRDNRGYNMYSESIRAKRKGNEDRDRDRGRESNTSNTSNTKAIPIPVNLKRKTRHKQHKPNTKRASEEQERNHASALALTLTSAVCASAAAAAAAADPDDGALARRAASRAWALAFRVGAHGPRRPRALRTGPSASRRPWGRVWASAGRA